MLLFFVFSFLSCERVEFQKESSFVSVVFSWDFCGFVVKYDSRLPSRRYEGCVLSNGITILWVENCQWGTHIKRYVADNYACAYLLLLMLLVEILLQLRKGFRAGWRRRYVRLDRDSKDHGQTPGRLEMLSLGCNSWKLIKWRACIWIDQIASDVMQRHPKWCCAQSFMGFLG